MLAQATLLITARHWPPAPRRPGSAVLAGAGAGRTTPARVRTGRPVVVPGGPRLIVTAALAAAAAFALGHSCVVTSVF